MLTKEYKGFTCVKSITPKTYRIGSTTPTLSDLVTIIDVFDNDITTKAIWNNPDVVKPPIRTKFVVINLTVCDHTIEINVPVLSPPVITLAGAETIHVPTPITLTLPEIAAEPAGPTGGTLTNKNLLFFMAFPNVKISGNAELPIVKSVSGLQADFYTPSQYQQGSIGDYTHTANIYGIENAMNINSTTGDYGNSVELAKRGFLLYVNKQYAPEIDSIMIEGDPTQASSDVYPVGIGTINTQTYTLRVYDYPYENLPPNITYNDLQNLIDITNIISMSPDPWVTTPTGTNKLTIYLG